jgi:PKD repeat protein
MSGTGLGSVVPSRDGTRIAVCSATTGPYPVIGQVAVYAFNNSTGFPSTVLAPSNTYDGYSDVAFSPNNQILYFNVLDNNTSIASMKQLDLTSLQMRTLITGPWTAFRQGPDGLIYISTGSGTRLHVINFPNQFNTANLNECGLNLNAIPLPPGTSSGGFASMPNMPLQCGTVQPADFVYTVSNCLTVNFTSLNCAGPYSWTFGDLTTGSGASVSHTYGAPGTYTVTLTVPGASPSTKSVTITLGLSPISIAGPTTVCDTLRRNYSVNGPAGYQYSWSVLGGSPASGTGNNIDVNWSAPGGSLQLTVVDPVTGCSNKMIVNVSWCPTCVKPPANMVAWYTLDEPTGGTAFENVLGANGSDVNAPPHVPGKVETRTVVQWRESVGAGRERLEPQLRHGRSDDRCVGAFLGDHRHPADRVQDVPGLRARIHDVCSSRGVSRCVSPMVARSMGTEYRANTGPLVADGAWHHVAATLQHAGSTPSTRLYVDGTPVFSAAPFVGNITNAEPLTLGARKNVFLSGPDKFFTGEIDEVELFQRALSQAEVASLYAADTLGKCKEFVWVPTTATLCRDRASVDLTLRICNYTATSQSYGVTFAGLPIGGSCTWAGPTNFQLLVPPTIVVPPGMRERALSRVPSRGYAGRPDHLLSGDGHEPDLRADLRDERLDRREPAVVQCHPGGSGGHGQRRTVRRGSLMQPSNEGSDPITVGYRWRVMARESDDAAAAASVSINGLPPGEMFAGARHVQARSGDRSPGARDVHGTAAVPGIRSRVAVR